MGGFGYVDPTTGKFNGFNPNEDEEAVYLKRKPKEEDEVICIDIGDEKKSQKCCTNFLKLYKNTNNLSDLEYFWAKMFAIMDKFQITKFVKAGEYGE